MRLRHALLVLLAERSHTGYELSRRMAETVSLFWSAHHSQIYPELSAMQADDLITFEASSGPGPREKKTWSITGAGRAELADWLGSPYQPRPPKDELVLRAFGASYARPGELAEVFRDEAEQIEQRLTAYAVIRRELESDTHVDDPDRPEFGWLLSLLHGIAVAEARLAWCRDAIRRLSR